MSKYKVGDKVKIVSKGQGISCHEFDIGDIVTINRTDGGACSSSEYKYHCSNLKDEWWWCRAKDIEKI